MSNNGYEFLHAFNPLPGSKFMNGTLEDASKMVIPTNDKNVESMYADTFSKTIEEMELIFGLHDTMTFCKFSAWMYRARASRSNSKEDIQKSDWYINKYQELLEKENKRTIRPLTEEERYFD